MLVWIYCILFTHIKLNPILYKVWVKLYGKDLLTRAHATWAQSPTIDHWNVGNLNGNRYKYEYTPNFIWSNTVHQAASACYDYFKWGEYLTGNGTDHPEGGWSDRNYYGSALACSFGILNKYPNSYNGFWGMPAPVRERIHAVVSAYGANATPTIKAITENVHRDVEVLMLYPMNLVAFEERVRTWPIVRECFMLSGEIDFILKCVTRDLSEFQDFIINELTAAPNVDSVKTSLAIRRSKFEAGIPIEGELEAGSWAGEGR